ncbi:MAG: multiheme c-type cytochrome [Myxococcota bacterium]
MSTAPDAEPSITPWGTLAGLLALIGAGTAAIIFFAGPDEQVPDDRAAEVLEEAQAFYDSRPYYQQPRPHSEVPDGLASMSAEACGSCHTEIYEEWQMSTHRRAWTQDAQFMEELHKSRAPDDPNKDMGWMCVNCHTPMTNQLPELVVGLEDDDIARPIYKKNPTYDADLQEEAITCATCHVRDGVVHGPYGDTNAPHPVAKDEDLLTEQICTSCHNAQAHWPSKQLACFFSTGDEWSKSVYAERGETCQSCHMPEVERKLAGNFDRPKRQTRRHWFGGSLIAKHPDYKEEVAELKDVYGSGVELELLPANPGATPNPERSPEFADAGDHCDEDEACTKLIVRVRNSRAGHDMPTGDPERHIDVHIEATSADGEVIASTRDRIASRYQWWPAIELEYDNRIAPLEHHDILLEVPGEPGDFDVDIRADKYRMYEEGFEHHDLEGEYVRGRNFHKSQWTVVDGQPKLRQITDDFGTRETLQAPE